MKWILALVATVACFAITAGSANAGQVLWIDDAQGRLGTVDVSTGAVNVVGNIHVGNSTVVMTDIAYAADGTLYGTSFTGLYTINTSTAAATYIGSTGLSGGNALVFGTDGTLYTAAGNSNNLYKLNVSTGHATNLGSVGAASAGDLAFNGGTLYMTSTANKLVDINLSPVGGTNVGNLGFSNAYGLATAADGVLYGVAGTSIYSINTTTGAGTFVLNYGGHGLGVANGTSFITEATVPEPSSIVMLGVAFTTMAAVAHRRRRSNA